ncbi:MAG: rhomboid family intramembrane serine protease [Actinomycetota bacterium]
MDPNPPTGLTPAPPTIEYCYRHPNVPTGVHCTRCGRPICTECMIPAAVGYQCPECVTQARREFRQGPGHPRLRVSQFSATKVLLGLLLAAFVVETVYGMQHGAPDALLNGPSPRSMIQLGAMQPFLIANGQYWRLFTAIFLHQGLIHIAFNAYALWLFGQLVDGMYGTRRFLLLFFLTGFLASATSYAFSAPNTIGVGASGAVFGIFGAFIAYHFRRRQSPMSAASLRWALTMIVLNAFLAFAFRSIDWHAHAGGLVAGFIAGYALEGFGTRSTRRLVAVAGVGLLVAAGVAMVVWRTDSLRSLPEFAQAVRFFSA